MYNSYAQAVGYTEVLSGLRKRMRNRLVYTDQISMNNNSVCLPAGKISPSSTVFQTVPRGKFAL